MPRILATFVFVLGILLNHVPLYGQNQGSPPKLTVFYSTSCHRCSEIKSRVIPEIEEEFKGRVLIEYRDIGDVENYKLMLGLQEKHGAKLKNTLPVFYFEGRFLNGEGDVRELLRSLIKGPLATPPQNRQEFPAVDLVTRFKNFRPLAIAGAGLIDGINPCAFTVIVFFISFLALQGYRKRELIVIGLSFISAVFFTYLLIGLGLFGFLYEIRGFWLLVKILNICVGVFSIILGILCLYDMFKFRKTGKTEGLVLQLPKGVKDQIHRVIGLHYRVGGAEKADIKKNIFK